MSLRTVRRLAGVLLLVGLGYVAWLLSHVHTGIKVKVAEKPANPAEVPTKAEEQTACFDDVSFDYSGNRLEAGRACKQPDGFSQLERVTLHVRREDGTERMSVQADHGKAPPKDGPIVLTGNVHFTTPDGLKVDGSAFTIDGSLQQASSDEPITFAQGDLSGKGSRLLHDWKNGRTHLEGEPELVLSGERTGGRTVTLRGQQLDHDQASRTLRSNGGARLDFPEGTVQGAAVDVVLSEKQEVERISAVGAASSRTVLAPAGDDGAPGPAIERTLAAERIDHEFAAGSALRRVESEGAAHLEGRSVEPALGIAESLEGDRLVLEFSGTQPLALAAIDAVGRPAKFSRAEGGRRREVVGSTIGLTSGARGFERLKVGGGASVQDEGGGARRSLAADDADIGFVPGGDRIDTLAFTGKPGRLSEHQDAPPMDRRLVARKADLSFDAAGQPASGTMEGSVEMADAGTRASADKAKLEDAPRRTVLEGHAAVEKEGRISHGDRIVRDDASGTLTVTGHQHTLVRDAKGLPGMQAEAGDEPVLITSDSLVLEEKARRARYDGGRPALRRGDTELVAEAITLDDAAGAMDATGDVRSKLRLARPGSAEQQDAASPFDPTRLVDGRGEEFHYRRDERLVSYVGSASLTQEKTELKAARVDIRLTASEPAQVDSLDATGSAWFSSPARGEAEGEHVRWQAVDDSVQVEGGSRPARARDAQGNFVTGAVIEMTKAGVHALPGPVGRTRGSSPALHGPAP